MPRRLAALVTVAACLLGSGTLGTSAVAGAGAASINRPPVVALDSQRAAQAPCPDIHLIGVRGSGEKKHDHGGFGSTVKAIVTKVGSLGPATTSAAVDYPAVAVGYGGWREYLDNYKDSVATGKRHLVTMIQKKLSGWRCAGQTLLFLVGYSQGAQVAGDVFQNELTAREKADIGGVVMVGDPRFDGDEDSPPNLGSYGSRHNGIWALTGKARAIGAKEAEGIRSYCVKGDPVCNFSLQNATGCQLHPDTCPHLHYTDRTFRGSTYTTAAAKWIVKRLAAVSAPTVTVATKPAGTCLEPRVDVQLAFPRRPGTGQLILNGVAGETFGPGNSISWSRSLAFGPNTIEVVANGTRVFDKVVRASCTPDLASAAAGVTVETQIDPVACTLTLTIDGTAPAASAFLVVPIMNGHAVGADGAPYTAADWFAADGPTSFRYEIPSWSRTQFYAVWNTGANQAGLLVSTGSIPNPC